jgi:hypothetical protein
VVAGEDLFEQLGRGAGCDGVGSNEGVRVAVADDLQVQVIRGLSAGEHRVQLLPGLLSCGQAMHGVGGDALGAVDGGGVAKAGRGLNVVGGEPCGEVAVAVSDGQVAAATYSSDGPAVSILDPVVGHEAESPVVGAGDDHVADTGLVPVRQAHFAAAGWLPRT